MTIYQVIREKDNQLVGEWTSIRRAEDIARDLEVFTKDKYKIVTIKI